MDMLVRLYDLPDVSAVAAEFADGGVIVRRAMVHERDETLSWVSDRFDARGWPAEVAVAFSRQPATCWIAVCEHRPVGFACTEVTARGMLGPIGVDPDYRGLGIGRLLVLRALTDQRAFGYAYSVIGQVGAAEFFSRVVDARPIAGSTPGPYPSDSALRS
jgi:GNAT superfamily N-acetyltransferase